MKTEPPVDVFGSRLRLAIANRAAPMHTIHCVPLSEKRADSDYIGVGKASGGCQPAGSLSWRWCTGASSRLRAGPSLILRDLFESPRVATTFEFGLEPDLDHAVDQLFS